MPVIPPTYTLGPFARALWLFITMLIIGGIVVLSYRAVTATSHPRLESADPKPLRETSSGHGIRSPHQQAA